MIVMLFDHRRNGGDPLKDGSYPNMNPQNDVFSFHYSYAKITVEMDGKLLCDDYKYRWIMHMHKKQYNTHTKRKGPWSAPSA